MICDNEIREFPKILGCLITEGLSSKHAGDIQGWGGKSITTPEYVTVSVLIESDVDMSIFARWYYAEIRTGLDTFMIELPIFGIKKTWEVKLVNGLEDKLDFSQVREIQLKLKVINKIREDIKECNNEF